MSSHAKGNNNNINNVSATNNYNTNDISLPKLGD